MAKTDTFVCSVITPERKVLTCDARFAAFPAHDGEMGVLIDRAPLVCKLGIGLMRIETPDQTHTLYIDEGFAQVVSNHLTILTEHAASAADLDPEEVDKALANAMTMTAADVEARSKAIRRAKTRQKLVR